MQLQLLLDASLAETTGKVCTNLSSGNVCASCRLSYCFIFPSRLPRPLFILDVKSVPLSLPSQISLSLSPCLSQTCAVKEDWNCSVAYAHASANNNAHTSLSYTRAHNHSLTRTSSISVDSFTRIDTHTRVQTHQAPTSWSFISQRT